MLNIDINDCHSLKFQDSFARSNLDLNNVCKELRLLLQILNAIHIFKKNILHTKQSNYETEYLGILLKLIFQLISGNLKGSAITKRPIFK